MPKFYCKIKKPFHVTITQTIKRYMKCFLFTTKATKSNTKDIEINKVRNNKSQGSDP